MQHDRPILVTGAGGFIGQDLVMSLIEQGFEVRAMIRPAAQSPFPAHERLHIVRADMRDEDSLIGAVSGSAAIVHLAAAKADERESEDINVGGARRLVRASESGGCLRLINISTQSTKITRKGIYARTKRAADEIFHASRLNVTSLLPSVVYGKRPGGVFGTILKFVCKAPVVVVLGDGRWRCAPVYVGDLASAVAACLQAPHTIGQVYDIGGPDVVDLNELIDRVGAAVGRCPPKIHVPFALALAIAHLVARFPRAPITVSNVLGSNQDTQIDIRPARKDFGFAPLSLDAGLKLVTGAGCYQRSGPIDDPVIAHSELVHDCRMIVRYLIDRDPTARLIERYCDAVQLQRFEADDPEWRWAQRHPRWLPCLDAATALAKPQSSLRQRIYLMTAILESDPAYAEHFLPRVRKVSVVGLFAGLAWDTTCAATKAVVGLPILALAKRFGK